MFEKMVKFLRGIVKKEEQENPSKDTAKERLHLVLMQDRANVSADFLELMKQEIIDVIKKYIDIDESAIDVRLTNKSNADGSNGAPALYANIPIVNVRNDMKKEVMSSKERPAYLKAEEKTEVASIKEEIQEEQTVKPEESDTVDTEVSSKEETSNATYTEKETIENEQIPEETVEIEEQEEVANVESEPEDETIEEDENIEEIKESENKQVENKKSNVQQQYNHNQKNYYGGKKKNRKHKRNNRNYPKRG